MVENLTPINIEDEMKRSYLDYAMSVIVGRALPDIRDGLKPVHRRILFSMHEMGLAAQPANTQVRQIMGEVMGKYHPHGDVPIYDSLVRMAQPFPCAIRWSMARGISVPWMAIRRPRSVYRSAAFAYRHHSARRHRQGDRRFPAQLR